MNLEELNILANRIYTSLQSTDIYSQVYIDQKFESQFNIEKNELILWITNEHHNWCTERPPLSLYAKYIAIALSIREIPTEILYDMLRAFNYYGSYDLVIAIASRFSNECSDYKLMKHLAKAYKSSGMYEEALNIYRKVILFAHKNNHTQDLAFFLVLLGKLYDDYHQKKGLHLFYHKTAYEIVTKQSKNFGNRIWQICAECYAKTIYKNQPTKSTSIYNKLINDCNNKNELSIRYQLNYCIVKVQELITQYNPEKIKDIHALLKDIKKLTGELRSTYYNERVYAIRTIQSYKLLRELVLKISNFSINATEIEILDNLKFNVIKCDIDNCKRICLKYNEKKYYVFALLELVEWQIFFSTKDKQELTQYTYTECLNSLNLAINALKIDSKNNYYINSNIYIDVLHNLAQMYTNKQNYIDALEAYNKIYDYLDFLLKHIKLDYKKLREILDGTSQKESAEFFIFSNKQKLELISFLYCDYESLADKLLLIGKEINSLRYMDMLNLVNDTIKFSKGIDYHSLNRLINQIISMAQQPDQLKPNVLIATLREVERKIENIRFTNDMIFKEDKFYTNIETQSYLSSLEFQLYKNNIHISENSANIEINFNKRYFQFILNSLIYNIIEAAKKYKKNEYNAEISFSVSTHSSCDIVKLHIKDNIGGIEEYKNIINTLNEGATPKSNQENRGYGLKLIKEITLKGMKWDINVNDTYKELVIPLCNLGG